MIYLFRTVILLSFLIALSACRPTPTQATPTVSSGQTNSGFPDAALTPTQVIFTSQGICDHPLWPLRDGARWDYQLTHTDGTQETITLQSTVQTDGVHLTFGNDSASLNCIDGALIGLPAGMIGSGHPSLSGIVGLNPRGAFLPSPDVLSMSAPFNLEVDGSGALNQTNLTSLPIINGKIVISSFPLDYEDISTEAGTFRALAIQQSIFYEITVQQADGSQAQVLISAAMQQYYAEHIGLVRVEFNGGSISSSSADLNTPLDTGASLELVSFSAP